MPSDFEKLMRLGGAGWFIRFVEELQDIRRRVRYLCANELLAVDLCIDRPASDEFVKLSKAARIRWIRSARIEVDHWEVEDDIRQIIEAREVGDPDMVAVLVAPFPQNVTLRRELTIAEREEWCRRAKLAGRGRFTERDLEIARAKRIDAICGENGRLAAGIYFVTTDHQFVKIGFATSIAVRMRTLQTGSPRPLHLLLSIGGSFEDERALHRRFAEHRVQGEWFRLSPALAEFIASEKAKSGAGE